jgi:O-antigen/teichoic acid export membrane protein
MQDVGKRMAKGAMWMVLFAVLQRCLGLVSTIILARLLLPTDFGLVAMGMSVFGVLEIISTFSFDLALIQNRQAVRRHYDTAWTFNLIFALTNGIALLLLAIPVANFFAEPRVQWVMYALALCALISGFDNIGVVGFQKELELHKDFQLGMAKKVAGFLVTVSAAVAWKSYWALLGGMLAGRVTATVLSYVMHPYRPRLSLAAARELFHFSKWLVVNNVLIFFNNRGADFVIGKLAGAQALGLYSVAYEISNLPTTELVFPISRAVFPGYSKIAGDLPRLRTAFLDVLSLIALVTIPAGVGIWLVVEPLVHVVLGPKWVGVIPLIQILAAFGVMRTLHGPTGSVYLAIGKPRLISLLHLVHIGVSLPLLIIFVTKYSITAAPWAILAGTCIALPVNYSIVMRELALPLGPLVEVLWRPLVSATLMLIVGGWIHNRFLAPAGLGQSLMGLLILIPLGAVIYVTTVTGLWRIADCPRGAESTLLALMKLRLRRSASA